MKILVVDDDKGIRDFLKSTLESESYCVDTAKDGEQGSYLARTNEYDLIVLDNVMPKKSGLEVCRELRAIGKHTPILMLSIRDEIEEKTEHLDNGADDYLAKPYSHQELMSRIRALTRRSGQVKPLVFEVGALCLDTRTQQVKKNGVPIKLTRKEFRLLELLMKHRGEVVSKGLILEHVWDRDANPLSNAFESHLVNLRKKIANKKLIRTISGRGYQIED